MGKYNIKLTKDKFIQRAITVHGNRYIYSKVEYNGMVSKVTIICKEHGEFSVTPGAHISGRNCPICAQKTCDRKRRTMYKNILLKFKQAHNVYLYPGYDMNKKISNWEKIEVYCPIHSCYFYPTINNHTKGSTCPKCGNSRKGSLRKSYKDKPTTLYILRIKNTDVYKVGITTNTISVRYTGQMHKIEVLYTRDYKNGIDAYDAEQLILLKSSSYIYTGKRLLKEGNTKLRIVDLLQYI